ncbi:Protein phosphatase 2C 77 [Hondaea fermentalgiana]|uniref:Protein phosphatase 2C 77 n=1 Tax=Hondaea fermentalgiana TaxID=2315210 RepID=A0A2R5GGR2_9STRA|nr:Protein phosphatase 2C 77 [Hondaea fermentalgiana]|eukprot:GBG30096.1 Protein phosphatase 2C 77 [Hondaea fermentalgiana]
MRWSTQEKDSEKTLEVLPEESIVQGGLEVLVEHIGEKKIRELFDLSRGKQSLFRKFCMRERHPGKLAANSRDADHTFDATKAAVELIIDTLGNDHWANFLQQQAAKRTNDPLAGIDTKAEDLSNDDRPSSEKCSRRDPKGAFAGDLSQHEKMEHINLTVAFATEGFYKAFGPNRNPTSMDRVGPETSGHISDIASPSHIGFGDPPLKKENQDVVRVEPNFAGIDNLHWACCLDGHGQYGKLVAEQVMEWILSLDHRPDDPAERARIESRGGVVRPSLRGGSVAADGSGRVEPPPNAPLRVWLSESKQKSFGFPYPSPGLMLTRSLGDLIAKEAGCSPEPSCFHADIAPGSIYVAASDGLWDVLEDDDVCKLVAAKASGGAERLAQELTAAALEAWARDKSADNVGILVAIAASS